MINLEWTDTPDYADCIITLYNTEKSLKIRTQNSDKSPQPERERNPYNIEYSIPISIQDNCFKQITSKVGTPCGVPILDLIVPNLDPQLV